MRARALMAVAAITAGGSALALGQSTTLDQSVAAVPQPKLAKVARLYHAEQRANRRLRRALRATRSRPAYVWWSTRDTRQVAEAVFDEQGTPAGERSAWRCILHRESGWRSDVWFGGARGWQARYAGSDRVNGVAQLRPYHADLRDDRVVSYATFRRTSDPVFSIRKALRLGFGPFFAQRGRCI